MVVVCIVLTMRLIVDRRSDVIRLKTICMNIGFIILLVLTISYLECVVWSDGSDVPGSGPFLREFGTASFLYFGVVHKDGVSNLILWFSGFHIMQCFGLLLLCSLS